MHTSRDDYLINTLRFVSAKEATQIYGAILPESLTSPEMKETKAYKTYLGFATGATPPKKARKFKKPASPQLTTILVSPEEPMGKSKRVKRPAKKSTKAPARGVVIRETPEMPLTQYEEARQKSLRDFHKTHSSGSGTVTKTAPSAAKINPSITNERTGVKQGFPDVTEEESSKNSKHETDENESGSEFDQEYNEEDIEDDKEEVNHEFVKTPSNDSDDEDETKYAIFTKSEANTKITDKAEGDEDEKMDYTTSQLYDDVDIWLNKLIQADDETVQKEDTDAELTNIMVNTHTDAELAAAVQAEQPWMPCSHRFAISFQRAPRAEEERLKREYHSIRQRASENSTEYMQLPPPSWFSWTGCWLRNAARNLEILPVTGILNRHKSGVPIAVTTQHNNLPGEFWCWTRLKEQRFPAVQGWSSSAGLQEEHCASSSGHADKKSKTASGRVFALTQDQAANTSDLPLQFDDKIRSVNALPLDMCEFDIILGIDWEKPMKIISVLKARTLLSHGCEGFLATIHGTTSDVSSIYDQPIISEFQDVFPEELPGIPPIREVEFNIELIPGAEPISKAPYRMAPSEVKRVERISYRSCGERWFYSPSVIDMGCTGRFSRRKNGSMRLERWLELLKDYDTNLQVNHPGKANVVRCPLSREVGNDRWQSRWKKRYIRDLSIKQLRRMTGKSANIRSDIDQADRSFVLMTMAFMAGFDEDDHISSNTFGECGLLQPLEIPVWKWDENPWILLPVIHELRGNTMLSGFCRSLPKVSGTFLLVPLGLPQSLGEPGSSLVHTFHPETGRTIGANDSNIRDMLRCHSALEWAGNWRLYMSSGVCGNDEDDSNNEQDSSGEDSDQENDSDDDKTHSNNENDSDSKHETDENESGSEFDQEYNEEDIEDDKEEVNHEFVKTPSNDSDDEDETKYASFTKSEANTKITDKAEGDEDEKMDYTTSQLYDDVDIWLNKLIQADDETVQKEDTDAELTNIIALSRSSFHLLIHLFPLLLDIRYKRELAESGLCYKEVTFSIHFFLIADTIDVL
ncbi:hypothetical protein Tco_0429518 [Tanacetum coccineum]